MKALTLLYDDRCPLCVRCARWLATEAQLVPIALVPSSSPEARARFGEVPWLGEELVVLGDDGSGWAGPAAFLVVLWALAEFREWSYRLRGEALQPLVRSFFEVVSHDRRRIGAWLDAVYRERVSGAGPDGCASGRCGAERGAVLPYR